MNSIQVIAAIVSTMQGRIWTRIFPWYGGLNYNWSTCMLRCFKKRARVVSVFALPLHITFHVVGIVKNWTRPSIQVASIGLRTRLYDIYATSVSSECCESREDVSLWWLFHDIQTHDIHDLRKISFSRNWTIQKITQFCRPTIIFSCRIAFPCTSVTLGKFASPATIATVARGFALFFELLHHIVGLEMPNSSANFVIYAPWRTAAFSLYSNTEKSCV